MRTVQTVALLICLTGLVGCAGRTGVYVLQQTEVIKMIKGDTITAEYDGWFFSNRAVNRVMNAKIDDINLK